MPFASLSPAKQKFLSSYFKPKTFFKKGATDEKKDKMADELIAFQKARDLAALQITKLAPSGVDVSPLLAELKAADAIAADPKSMRAAEAKAVVEGLLPKIQKASDDFCKAQKKKAKDAIDLVKTYLGMALEIPKLEGKYAAIETACGKDPIDYVSVKTAAEVIVAKQAALKIRSDAYRAEHDRVKLKIKEWCEDELPTITDDLVKEGRAKVIALLAVAHQKLAEFSIKLAETMAQNIWWEIEPLQKLVKAKDDYVILKDAGAVEIKKLMDKRNPGVDDACKEIEADLAKAKAFEDSRAYYDATLIMKTMAKRVADNLPIADAFLAYETAAKAAATAIEALSKHPQFDYVKPDFVDIKAHFEAAEGLAAEFKYDKAKVRMEMLPDQCKALIEKAAKGVPYDELAAKVTSGDAKAVLAEAKKLLADLKGHPGAKLVPDVVKDIETKIGDLEKLSPTEFETKGQAGIEVIIPLLVNARKLVGSANQRHERAERLEAKVKALQSSHPHAAYVKSHLDKILELIKNAKAGAIKGDEDVAAKLTDGEAQYEKANQLASAEEVYRLKRHDLEAEVKEISKDSADFPDKAKTLDKIKEHMKAADEASKAFDHVKTGGMMKAVEALLLVVTIGTKAKAGTPPTPENIKKLMEQPGGQKIMDDMVAALPAEAQKDVLIVILEARFNMDVKMFADAAKREAEDEVDAANLDVPAPNLMAYYEMLKAVPDAHTKLNPSMARFDQVEDDSGSYYESSGGAVVMACSVSMKAEGNPLGEPSELETIDPDSVTRTDTPMPTYGKWTTLHEVGHAVDDRKGFMNANGKSDAYGGWKEYGGNVTPIAKIIADHFEYDNSYIERKMAGGSPANAEIPPELAKSEGDGAGAAWEKRRTDFEAWLAGVRTSTDVWDSASETKKWAIGDTMYHEAYDNSWVSYKVSARTKGVSGYQFRAPGEWFSELYAAYHTQKLNKNHPATKWLSTL